MAELRSALVRNLSDVRTSTDRSSGHSRKDSASPVDLRTVNLEHSLSTLLSSLLAVTER
jgi:hypothetical protein